MAKPQRIPSLIELDQEIAKRSLAEFCKMAWAVLEPATPIKWGWALDAMCEHLEAVHSGEIKRLLMNVPRHDEKPAYGRFLPCMGMGAVRRRSVALPDYGSQRTAGRAR